MDLNKQLIKNKVTRGIAWTYGEKFLAQGINLIISVILARLIMPDQYGVIAIITIFTSIMDVLVTSGLGSSLVQKKDVDEVDFSSIFFAGLFLSFILYIIIFFTAPLISHFYKIESLSLIIRVICIRIPLSALNNVQNAYIQKKMLFIILFESSLYASVISGIVSIIMAYYGLGVWALIALNMLSSFISTFIVFIKIDWKPKLLFSFCRLQKLLSYAWKILCITLMWTLTNNIQGLIIGKKYNTEQLAYFTRGKQFPELISANFSYSINRVIFPTLSLYQDDLSSLLNITRRTIQTNAFILAPCLIGMVASSDNLVKVLLTNKWLQSVPYMRLICIIYLLQPLQSVVIQTVNAMGRSDLYLKVEIIKRLISISILIISVIFFNNVMFIVIGMLVSEIISTIVYMPINKNLYGYFYKEQILDIITPIFTATLMGIIIFIINFIKLPSLIIIIIQIIVGLFSYIFFSAIFNKNNYTYFKNLLKPEINRLFTVISAR